MPSADGFGALVGGNADATGSSVAYCPARPVAEKKPTASPRIDPRRIECLQVLAGLNLPPEVLLPELLPRLRQLVPAASSTSYWLGTNKFLAYRFEESDQRVRFAKPTTDSLRALGSLTSSLDAARGINFAHGLHNLSVPFHRDGEVTGFICLHRPVADGPFQINEQAAVVRLARRIVISHEPPSYFAERLTAPIAAGVYALSDTGMPLFACDDAHRTLQLAGFEHLEYAVRDIPPELNSRMAKRGGFSWERRNACGRFEFNARRTQAGAGRQPAALVVSITYHAPIALVTLRNAEKLGLTAKQSTVAVAVVHGESYDSIATQLGISRHTAIEHARNLQTRLHARNRAELITRLVTGDPVSNAAGGSGF